MSLSLRLGRKVDRGAFQGHYNNTYKAFTYNDFSYNLNRFDIKYIILFTIIKKVIYK